MKILYLDDSYRKEERILGYGGYHIDSVAMRRIGDEVAGLKRRHGIPQAVELKWAPPHGHFLRARFTRVRHELYRDALAILERNGARVMCAVHFLNDCYGVSLHGCRRRGRFGGRRSSSSSFWLSGSSAPVSPRATIAG